MNKISNSEYMIRDGRNMYDKIHDKAKSLVGEVTMGYGLYTDPITGISSLEQVLRKETNEIVMGGTLFALEKLFNVSSSLNVSYLNDIMGFGTDGPTINEKYPKDTAICLFDVGIGGCGNSYTDVKAVLQQREAIRYYDSI